jgi:hypothetical protein
MRAAVAARSEFRDEPRLRSRFPAPPGRQPCPAGRRAAAAGGRRRRPAGALAVRGGAVLRAGAQHRRRSRFFYANRAAQARFEYGWDEFVTLPSRLSAEAPDRAERQRLLDAVTRDGFIGDYRGLRIAKSGRRFWIENATVWQLIDESGTLRGQAATFRDWREM